MTSATKPQINNALQRWQSRTKPQPQVTCKKFDKVGCAVSEICLQRDRHTHTHRERDMVTTIPCSPIRRSKKYNKQHSTNVSAHSVSVNNAAGKQWKRTSRTRNQTKVQCRLNRRSKLLPSWHRWRCCYGCVMSITCSCLPRLMTPCALFNGDLRTWRTCNAMHMCDACHVCSQ